MNDLADVKRGEEAERLLSHPLLSDAFAKTEEGIIKAMSDAPMGDEKTHNRLVIALQLLTQIKRSIEVHVQTGKIASINIENTAYSRLKKVAGFR